MKDKYLELKTRNNIDDEYDDDHDLDINNSTEGQTIEEILEELRAERERLVNISRPSRIR